MALELFALAAKLKLESGEFIQGMKDAVQEAGGFKKVMTSVTGTIINGINKLTDYADKVDKGSKSIGVSTRTYQQFSYALGMSGASVESLTMGISTLNSIATGNGTKAAISALEKIGISPEELASMSTADERLTTVLKTLADMEDKTERANIAEALFGKGKGKALAAFLDEGSKGIEDLINEANNLGLVMSEESINAGVKAKDSMDKLNQVLDRLLLEALTPLLPPITDIVTAFMPLIKELVPIAKLLADGINAVLDPIFKLAGINREAETAKNNAETRAKTGEELYTELQGVYASGGDVGTYMRKKYGDVAEKYIEGVLNTFSVETTGKTRSGRTMANPEGMVTAAKASLANLISEYEASSANISSNSNTAADALGNVSSAAENAANAMNSIPPYSGPDGSHAKGDWNIPYDNYSAILHRGEMVLTSSQARRYRDGEGGSVDTGAIAAAVADAIRGAMANLNLRAYVVDRDVTDAVSRRIGNDLKARRFAT